MGFGETISAMRRNEYSRTSGKIAALLAMPRIEQLKHGVGMINDVGSYLWDKQDQRSVDQFVEEARKCAAIIESI